MKWLRLLAKLKPEDIQHVQIKLEDIKRDQLQEDLSGAREDSGNLALDGLIGVTDLALLDPRYFPGRVLPKAHASEGTYRGS